MAVGSAQIYTWLERYAGIVAEQKQYLTGLDAAIGDGDHGINMGRGFQTVLVKLAPVRAKGAGRLLKTTGRALRDRAAPRPEGATTTTTSGGLGWRRKSTPQPAIRAPRGRASWCSATTARSCRPITSSTSRFIPSPAGSSITRLRSGKSPSA